MAVGDVIYVGTDNARLLRFAGSGSLEVLRGFEVVPGRDAWYAGSALIDGRRVVSNAVYASVDRSHDLKPHRQPTLMSVAGGQRALRFRCSLLKESCAPRPIRSNGSSLWADGRSDTTPTPISLANSVRTELMLVAAYLRIAAARAARQFPTILDRLSDGALHLTAINLLAPHLTAANHVAVLDAARHKGRRDVEQLVARLRPQPDVPAVVRKLPAPKPATAPQAPLASAPLDAAIVPSLAQRVLTITSPRPLEVKPLAPERYKVQFTVSRETHQKLRQAQDLLRHTIPSGDLAAIFDRALTLLLAEVSKTKLGATDRPRQARTSQPRSRHIPASVKREVWRRDAGRCAFHGEQGRCTETGFLEFHHVMPFAEGGATTTENLQLRCRVHNRYEAEQDFAPYREPFSSTRRW